MKLGFLGGTFDPIHLGHLRSAEEIAESLGLEKVYLIPAALPPHKTGEPVSSFPHRIAMARSAAEKSPLLDVLDLEGRRPGISYSIETLKELNSLFSEAEDLYFIIGTDAFFEIRTWKSYRNLFKYAHFVLVERPGFPLSRTPALLEELEIGASPLGGEGDFLLPSGRHIFLVSVTHMDISSTRIRNLRGKGKSIRFLIPESVHDYIVQEGLYLSDGNH
ncbi:MAG: nicotinate (nicotinamide) nucleotide adenylyltransferase [Deltaproteobacteria bacterium CG23_combo_of_CG06-09_8_20_14_all_51_20]|nr:nicotinate (nicotinamide) nucleotide adenylyltransferase [bacterium]OIP37332.1 MAG: nicotinate (nicotinamide) nucleotide adenylyltransferase [Desulfobacteraceae bacterium CG2_30_51_40]PIP47662.1 MAG: nicotinate (nicotinamide) nucleotide adenylyltransferase [Deltaproteobacteria bacterium CG23_combo_of_CG06-09_8_20_14_all_51_20]PIY21860.1 MAG: nicotinate (nicotinamide) nucleotide adenylyltransferase [Deltaproteobacteria bacterium CG_4_10_14_3_um_filter_51_14]PJB37736.1 MAG: nicotinate (nicotin